MSTDRELITLLAADEASYLKVLVFHQFLPDTPRTDRAEQ
jgi:hypothetical protein